MDHPYGAPRRFRWAWAGLILALTVVPFLAVDGLAPKGFTYTWLLPPYPADGFAYRAWARQAYDGRWLFSLKYTALPNRPFLFLPFFLAAGRLARGTGLDIGAALLLMKTAGVALFFWAFFGFLRQLKLTRVQSVAASLLAGISSGFGGILPLLSTANPPRPWTPVDVWLVDSNTFWSLLWNPVYPYSLALMILAVRWTDEGLTGKKDGLAWRAGLCLGFLAFLHPYPLAVLYPLLTVLCVVKRPKDWLPFWLRLVGASLPGALYLAALSIFHPLVRTHNVLGTAGGVNLVSCLAGLGLPLALAAAGLFLEGRAFAKRYWPLFLWIGVSLVLTSCPIWFRIKYIFGTHLPVCILAGAAAESLLARLPGKYAEKLAAAGLVFALTLLTPIANLRTALVELDRNADEEYLIDADMTAGLEYLEKNAARSDVVFAAPPTSAKICAFAGNTVLWGHWAQAVDYEDRQAWMAEVFSAASGLSLEERRRRFWDSGVEYAFLDGSWRTAFETGPASRVLADADKVFENREVAIYRRPARAGSPRLNSENQDVRTAVSLGSPISRR